MDINIVLNRLLPGAEYRLNKANPPHEIIEWKDSRKQPSQEELETEWAKFQQELSVSSQERENFKATAKKFLAILAEEDKFFEIYLEEIS